MRPSSRKRSTASFVGTSSESFRSTTTAGVYVPPSDRPSSAMRRPRPSTAAAAESASSVNPSTRSARFAAPPSVSVRSTHTSIAAAAPVPQQSLSAPRADSRAEDSDEDSLYDDGIERENAVAQAKNDLLQLGIELDDDIIERLQKNLKIEKIFHIARQASKIVTKKASADADRSMEQEMLYYRNTTTQPSPQKTAPHNAQAHIAAVAGDHPIKSILNPKIAIQYDERHAVELLQKLENGRADIEPQHRPVAEMAIEKFRLQYARYPDKFICRLLGQKYPTIASIELAKKRLNSKNTAPNANNNAADNTNNSNTNVPTAEKEAVPVTESTALANTASMSVKSSTSRKYSTSSAAAVVTSSSAANNNNEKAPKESTTASAAQAQSQTQSQPAQKTIIMQRAATQAAINEQIMEWILQKRYLIQSEFQAMIQRVLPSHMQDNEEIALILFSLLAETKKLAPNQRKKRVVDLWGFLTLLKVASDESRRSYDAKTSRLATDIEFWRRDNGKHVVLSEENGPLLSNLSQKPGKINTKQYTDYSQDPVKILIDPSQAPSKNTTYSSKKNPDGRIIHHMSTTVWPENKSVAQLINQPNHEHITKATQGRCILGYIAQETTNVCDVPTALHSPKRAKTPQKAHYSDRAMQRDNNLPLVTSTELLDSRKVAYLLGQEELVSKLRNHNGDDNDKPRPSSVNRFRRDHFDNTSMACAFGRPDSAFPPPPPFESHHTRKSKEHPIAGYVSGKTQSRPMWMKEPHSMHWENQRPSVAAALGGNTNHLHNNRI